jgi:hypothetical protein
LVASQRLTTSRSGRSGRAQISANDSPGAAASQIARASSLEYLLGRTASAGAPAAGCFRLGMQSSQWVRLWREDGSGSAGRARLGAQFVTLANRHTFYLFFVKSPRDLQNAMHFVDVRIVKARMAYGLMREDRRTSLTDKRLELFGKRNRQRRGSTW